MRGDQVFILPWILGVSILAALGENPLYAGGTLSQRRRQPAPAVESPCEVKPIEAGAVRCDTSLLFENISDGVRFSTEWSKVEKVRDLLRDYSLKRAGPCYFPSLDGLSLNLYVGRSAQGFKIGPETPLRVFGSRLQKRPGSDEDELLQVGFPPDRMVTLRQLFDDRQQELQIVLEDLAQVELVYVPRIEEFPAQGGQDKSCFQVHGLSLVPSRVFDDTLPWSEVPPVAPPQQLPSQISLRARKEVLERLARRASWIDRMAMEKPQCRIGPQEEGYSELQVQSLHVTLTRIFPGREFLQDCNDFWSLVKERIRQLRRWDPEKRQELFRKGSND